MRPGLLEGPGLRFAGSGLRSAALWTAAPETMQAHGPQHAVGPAGIPTALKLQNGPFKFSLGYQSIGAGLTTVTPCGLLAHSTLEPWDLLLKPPSDPWDCSRKAVLGLLLLCP